MGSTDHPDDPLATLTHARLRIEQGDLAEARALLRGLLLRHPDHRQARVQLATLEAASVDPERPGRRRRGVERLKSWLERLEQNR